MSPEINKVEQNDEQIRDTIDESDESFCSMFFPSRTPCI